MCRVVRGERFRTDSSFTRPNHFINSPTKIDTSFLKGILGVGKGPCRHRQVLADATTFGHGTSRNNSQGLTERGDGVPTFMTRLACPRCAGLLVDETLFDSALTLFSVLRGFRCLICGFYCDENFLIPAVPTPTTRLEGLRRPYHIRR